MVGGTPFRTLKIWACSKIKKKTLVKNLLKNNKNSQNYSNKPKKSHLGADQAASQNQT